MKFRFLLFALLFVSGMSLYSQQLKYEGIDGEMGFLWKNNEGYDKEEGDSGPDLLTFTPGISVYFTMNDNWFFRPSLYLYAQTLEYLSDRDYTIPVDYANIKSMSVMSMMLQGAGGYRWKIGERHNIGLQAGPAYHLQVPTIGPGDEDREDMFASLAQEFLYLNLGLWYYNPLTERYGFNFKIETGLPMYNTWMDNGLPFQDDLIVHFQIGIRVLAGN